MLIKWISKNEPTPRQRAELTRLFGDHVLQVDAETFSDAGDIKRRVQMSGASEVVVVAPLSVLKKLLDFGLRPLTAKMIRVDPDKAEVSVHGRHYKFVKFERLTAIDFRYEEVLPCCAGTSS